MEHMKEHFIIDIKKFDELFDIMVTTQQSISKVKVFVLSVTHLKFWHDST